MLHVSRKIGESVVIGGNVIVKLLDVRGRTAKLGFEFPKGVQVFRQELYERIEAENRAAVRSSQYIDRAKQREDIE